ncbi:putative cytochrome P450 [Xylariaceae sp. FL0804]|nr:putative cytochrome P450 [Xylariaceae sp. FL0804]
MKEISFSQSHWTLLLALHLCYVLNANFQARTELCKRTETPPIGSFLEKGYHKFKTSAFQLIRNNKNRKLTPRLNLKTPGLEKKLSSALADYLPASEDWTEFRPYYRPVFAKIPVLGLFPAWLRPAASFLDLPGPNVQELLKANDAGHWSPKDTNEEDMNINSWLVDLVKGKDRNPDTLAHVMVILALWSVHTVLLRVVNVLYDITVSLGLLDELRAEIGSVAAGTRWGYSPPTTTGLKRLFQQPYTFRNGLQVARGTYVCLPIYYIENDPAKTPSPETFDGLRYANRNIRFISLTPTSLNFGYGKAACPGRFFASLKPKMLLVKRLTEYNFRFLPGTGRPGNIMVHEVLFTWPWTKVMVRRRQGGSSLF